MQHYFRKTQPDFGTPHRDLYAVAIYTGLRAGELAASTSKDVDLGQRLITVSKSWDGPTKSAKVRWVPIQDEIRPIIERLVEQRPSGRLSPSVDGTALTKSDRTRRAPES